MYQTTFGIFEPYGPVLSGPGASKKPSPFSLKKLTSIEQESIEKAKKYAKDQSIRVVLLKQTKQHEIQQQSNIKKNQAIVLLSRIYVGSINYDIREEAIKTAFKVFGPVKVVSLSYDPITQKHMGYAFLEFEYPEAAQLALSPNQIVTISGRQVKVGRPTNMPHSGPMVDELLTEARKYFRIYVASVHPNLNDDDLRELFESFGKIKTCHLEVDPSKSGKHRGFGFIEYETAQAASDAVSSMNSFNLGGMSLKISHAITPPNTNAFQASAAPTSMPTATAMAAASITAQVQELEVQQIVNVNTNDDNIDILPLDKCTIPTSKEKKSRGKFSATVVANDIVSPPTVIIPQISVPHTERLDNKPAVYESELKPKPVEMIDENQAESLDKENIHIRGREARNQMMQKLMRATPQRVVVLKNMVDQNDVDDQLQEEVFEECSKYGDVEDVKIYIESLDGNEVGENNGIVKVFVVFLIPESRDVAIANIHGRSFGGRIVLAEKYDQDLYDAGDLSA